MVVSEIIQTYGYRLLLWLLIVHFCRAQRNDTFTGRHKRQCDCMEYWQCVSSGGKPYSYCLYSSKICCFIDPNAQAIGILPKPTKSSNCGTKGSHGGKDGVAEAGEWAWHAAVLEKPQDLYVCGGALVDEYWVLTAAHCVDEYKSASSLKVRLGEFDVSSTNEQHAHEEFDVAQVTVHPGFNNRTLLHDIALLRLGQAARRRPNVNVVCMPPEGTTNGEFILSPRCYVTGWGKKSENGEHSVSLKEVNIPLWRNDDCERVMKIHFGPNYRLPATSVCAGAEGRDACDGDGGGPLVCEKNGRWYQVGVVSFGIGCGRPNTPGIYTRVESYNNWIYQVVMKS